MSQRKLAPNVMIDEELEARPDVRAEFLTMQAGSQPEEVSSPGQEKPGGLQNDKRVEHVGKAFTPTSRWWVILRNKG